MEEPTLAEQLVVPSSQLTMITMHQLMNMSFVYRSKSSCATFIANYDSRSYATVSFNGLHYNLPPWSISILPDCKTIVFNTAKIGAQSTTMKMQWLGGFSWKSYTEDTKSLNDKTFTKVGLLEQLNTTWDHSDYLWYTT